jgi:hypothetical protein
VPEIGEGLCRVFAFVGRHVRNAFEQVGVVLERTDVGPGDLCAVKAREVCHAIGKPNSLAGF